MEYISADVLFWRSLLCTRKGVGEKEGGKGEGKGGRDRRRKNLSTIPSSHSLDNYWESLDLNKPSVCWSLGW